MNNVTNVNNYQLYNVANKATSVNTLVTSHVHVYAWFNLMTYKANLPYRRGLS